MEGMTAVSYEHNLASGGSTTVMPLPNSDSHFFWDDSCIKIIYSNFYNEEGVITGATNVIYQPAQLAQLEKVQEVKNPGLLEEKLPVKPRRGKVAQSKKDLCKQARNSGKTYEKLKGKGKGRLVAEKEVGGDCECPNKCFEKVGIETVNKIFHDFWGLADYNSQNAYLFGLINMSGVKRRYTKNEISRRNFTITYNIKKRGQNLSVCKKAFLHIHGLQNNRGRINNLVSKMKEGESVPPPDRRGKHSNRPNAYSDEAIDHVVRHLRQCPKAGRRKKDKEAKTMELSKKKCYELYVDVYCREHNIVPVSLDKFKRIFWGEGYRFSQVASKPKDKQLGDSCQSDQLRNGPK